ncbi:H-type small acid-soluble spore protein [Geosporobacter ferrireducens]|uniref:H-type small acid-soluble spore protein n=1 Tax=Geosporobacter ferrireducens TaxID=1424294 RepID=A0A1D8GK54_9FIRM|nr:H-type small acid-soluble spore protein [Geosporobacter ferrireducens]AOT71285.1 hypothetical protein Gferi_18020 [Geosporobacter ferrireducens]MTI58099.1 small, acid-soluble spore protein, H family [Geosporobacter ferrireducens]
MQYDRAQQILNSEKTIPVFYEGKSIWIEKLNAQDQTAIVTSDSGQTTVPVIKLEEGHLS